MKKAAVVAKILETRQSAVPAREQARVFAPSNIALCKYWGKRDAELNLPQTSSLSISLGEKGSTCTLRQAHEGQDQFKLNDREMELTSSFSQRLSAYLDLFRTKAVPHFQVEMQMNLPLAAGLASSACGFASLVLALNDFFAWGLAEREFSILARLGSGSACRSVMKGFVEWQAGVSADGMDSYAVKLNLPWPELRLGLLLVSTQEKPLSSRLAMERTAASSPLYASWPAKVERDLSLIKQALAEQNFQALGETAESNALTMHALMLSAWPPISYALPQTITAMHEIWQLRQEGLPVYFTQDAGPNLKLLFLAADQQKLSRHFPEMEVVIS